MPVPLGSLLGDAMNRSRLARTVQAVQVVREADQTIARLLPAGRTSDAKAISYQNGVLTFSCKNSGVMAFIHQHERTVTDLIRQAIPGATVDKIRTRLERPDRAIM